MSLVVQESICILFTPSVFKASRNSEGLGFYLHLYHSGPKMIQQPYFPTYKDDGIAGEQECRLDGQQCVWMPEIFK